MNTYLKPIRLFIIFAAIFIISCVRKEIPVTAAHEDYAKKRWPEENMAMLQRGKIYYAVDCSKCHGLKNPTHLTETEWKDIMPKMQKKAHIADTTADVILKFLLTETNTAKK